VEGDDFRGEEVLLVAVAVAVGTYFIIVDKPIKKLNTRTNIIVALFGCNRRDAPMNFDASFSSH